MSFGLFFRNVHDRFIIESLVGANEAPVVQREEYIIKHHAWNSIQLWFGQCDDFTSREEQLEYIFGCAPHIEGTIIIIDRTLEFHHFQSCQREVPARFFVIHSVDELENALNVQFSDTQRQEITHEILYPPEPIIIRPLELLQAFLTARSPNHEPEAERRTKRLKKEWHEKLGEPIPLTPEDEENPNVHKCIACCENVASVAFYPCEHQVYCDVCLRRVWEDNSINHECPTCRDPVDDILKPKQ